MGWAAVAQGIAGFFINYDKSLSQRASQWAQWRIQEANANAQNTVNQANADAANLVRAAGNDFQAAQAALGNAKRSIGNQQKSEAIGRQQDALAINAARQIDSMVRGKLSAQLQAASTLGAIRANEAARGVGGGSAAMMRSVAQLAKGSADTVFADKTNQITYDGLLQSAGLVRTKVLSQDLGVTLPNMDYGINVAPLVQAPDYIEQGSALRDAVRSVFGQTGSWSNVGSTGGTQTQGVQTDWYSVGSNSATGYSGSYGFAQGNGQDYGLSTYTGTSRPVYASSGYSGMFTESGGGGGNSGGWFSGNTGGGTGGADNSYFSGA